MENVTEDKSRLQKAAHKLLIAAWCIEIIAALIGFFFAISRLIPSLDGTFVSSVTALQGALPFLAVAVVEVTKIPLAYACYETNNSRWKVVFGFALFAVTFVTFETFLGSFESYQAKLTDKLQPTLESITTLQRRIDVAQNIKISADDIIDGQEQAEGSHQKNILMIEGQFTKSIEPLSKQKQSIINSYDSNTAGLSNTLKRLQNDLKSHDDEYGKRKDQINKEFVETVNKATSDASAREKLDRDTLQGYEKDLSDLFNQDLINREELQNKHNKKRDNANIFKVNGVKLSNEKEMEAYDKRFESQKITLEKKIDNLRGSLSNQSSFRDDETSKRDEKLDELNRNRSTERDKITKRIDEVSASIADSKSEGLSKADQVAVKELDRKMRDERQKRADLIKRENERFSNRNSMFESQQEKIEAASLNIEETENALVAECAKLNAATNNNQVYRIATSFFGLKDSCELTKKQLTIVTYIWFGSIAFIVAALGPVLAFASFVVRENKPRVIIKEVEVEKIVEVEVIKEVPVDRQVAVEVIREVPVDKVVFRDVPVEIIKKEVVHIPVYTNDKSLLGKTASNDDEA